jgi:hypothetical protein
MAMGEKAMLWNDVARQVSGGFRPRIRKTGDLKKDTSIRSSIYSSMQRTYGLRVSINDVGDAFEVVCRADRGVVRSPQPMPVESDGIKVVLSNGEYYYGASLLPFGRCVLLDLPEQPGLESVVDLVQPLKVGFDAEFDSQVYFAGGYNISVEQDKEDQDETSVDADPQGE